MTPPATEWAACRVVFGRDARLDMARELDAMGWMRALVVTTPGRASVAAEIGAAMGTRLAGICAIAQPHVPAVTVTAALSDVERLEPDVLVAIGGGSAIGLAKAIALSRAVQIAALPTTYAGSEMTRIYGTTEAGSKRTGRDLRVAPRLVVYDPMLTLSLAPAESSASGMNAIAHAVEAIYATHASPLAVGAGVEAIRALADALPRIHEDPNDIDARSNAQRGAHAAGFALEVGTMGLHHRICHVLGGTFGMPHARTHAALLPHVVRFNLGAPSASDAMERIAAALGAADPAEGLAKLNAKLGVTPALSALGLRSDDIDRAAEIVVSGNYPNPRPVAMDDVRRILTAAL